MPENDPADLFWRILQGLGKTALDLGLEEFGDHVYLQITPDDVAGYSVRERKNVPVVFPAITFNFEGQAEEGGPEDTGTGSWRLPVRCWIADKQNVRQHDRLPIYLRARKALMDTFDEPPGEPKLRDGAGEPIAEVVNVTVVPGVIFDPHAPVYQYLLSGFVIVVETEEPR